MKKKEKTSYRTMEKRELTKVAAELREKLLQAKLTPTYREVKNLRECRNLRKKLAVAQTLLREHELSNV